MFAKLRLTEKEDLKLLEEVKKEQGRLRLTEAVTCRKAEEADLPVLLRIAQEGSAWLKKQGVDQWQDGYPAERHFRFDLERGECFVVCHGNEAAGFFVLSTREEASYAAITDGKWTAELPYCVLHRCAVAKKFRGTGLAQKLMQLVERQARELGLRCVRTDTHRKNKPMQHLLRESGYRYRGNICVTVGEGHDTARQAYEKLLKK